MTTLPMQASGGKVEQQNRYARFATCLSLIVGVLMLVGKERSNHEMCKLRHPPESSRK